MCKNQINILYRPQADWQCAAKKKSDGLGLKGSLGTVLLRGAYSCRRWHTALTYSSGQSVVSDALPGRLGMACLWAGRGSGWGMGLRPD